jgi:hypothetical protein
MGGVCNTCGGRRVVYRILVGKPERKNRFVRPRPKWEDNIKIDLQEVGFGGMDLINLAQDKDRFRTLVFAIMKLWDA